MGLVMQEPTLFNYTVKENILYGNPQASNFEIKEAAQIANCLEFIESEELIHLYEDSAESLFQGLVEKESDIISLQGKDKYDDLN